MPAQPPGRGRGRGRGSTLPAWMTRGNIEPNGVGGNTGNTVNTVNTVNTGNTGNVGNVGNVGTGSVRGNSRNAANRPHDHREGARGGGAVDRARDRGRGGGQGAPPDRDRDRPVDRDRGGRIGGREGGGGGGGGGTAPDRDRDRRGGERGYGGRDHRERDHERDRERDRESGRSHRDRREDDRVVRKNDRPPDTAAVSQQRGHRGLGFDDNARSHGERDISTWERDRGGGMGRGRGRGLAEMNFVRGGVHDRDRDRDGDNMNDRDRRNHRVDGDRDKGRDPREYRGESVNRDMGRDRDVRDRDLGRSNKDGMGRGGEPPIFNGMGRGRGRGRGADINKPAWMTAPRSGGPVGLGRQHGDSTSSKKSRSASPRKGKDKETMERLLAQARQVQKERTRDNDQQQRDVHSQRRGKSPGNSQKDGNGQFKSSTAEQSKEGKKRKQQGGAEEAAKEAEKYRKLEEQREQEEQRQLRALVEDYRSDDEKKMDETTPKGISGRKGDVGEEEDDELFEFEKEEEREERMARRRREERRKKMRKLEESLEKEDIKVDRPRNAAGVVQSELIDTAIRRDMLNASATKMEVEFKQAENDVGNGNNAQNEVTKQNDSDDDSFDIFASDNATPTPSSKNAISTANSKRNNATANNAQECDDAEGYYKANIGEIITLPKERRIDYDYNGDAPRDGSTMARFRVLGIIGKGVFSSVIKCVEEVESTITTSPNSKIGSSNGDASSAGRIVAMKVIRNNEVMARAAAKEMRILRMLCRQQQPKKSCSKHSKREGGENDNSVGANLSEDEEDAEERERRERENHNIVRLLDVDPQTITSSTTSDQYSASSAYASLPPPEFRSHPIFLFEFLPYNLREVLSKFGKNVGINLTAVRSYARQLLCALGHLERHRVVHADLKPDNILVSANFSTVKLADFGSAFFETDHDNDPTPYLVSRFYRPPEVILGLEYDRMVDLWSAATTLSELFTGSVLFPGLTNNDMLVRFMDGMGPFSHKMVRRHAASYTRMGLSPHFEVGKTGGTYQLRKQDVDRVTGQPVCRLVNVLSAKAESRLAQVLLRASKGGGGTLSSGERVDVLKFADFLNRCLALDPARRLSVRDALRHDFFVKKKKREDPQ